MRYRGCTLLLTAVLVAGCASAARPTQPPPAASSPRPPAHVADLRLVGVNGAAAWQLTATALTVSYDAGAHWSTVPLPPRVVPKAVGTVTAAPGRGVWLGVPDGNAFDVYRRATTSWTRIRLIPAIHGEIVAGGGATVSITLQPHGIVTVVAGWGMTGQSAAEWLFVSDDDGVSFRQHQCLAPHYVHAVTFMDRWHAVAVIGPPGIRAPVYRSADGGATWTPVALPFGETQSMPGTMPGTPEAVGGAVLLPVLVDRANDSQVVVLRSTDFGATFVRPSARLDIPDAESAGDPQPGQDGATIWVPVRNRIYETTDAGAHWTTVPTDANADPIGLAGGSRAIGVLTDSGCRQVKADCFYDTYLATTSDGGRTWRTVG